jgi:predicted NUDIX family NTP pyrophosphohydrolase
MIYTKGWVEDMSKQSAGFLMYRKCSGIIEVFLVHPGGPFWEKKDLGAWSIPKGEFTSEEDPLQVAQREFEEETGIQASGNFTPLASLKQPSGKVVHAWAFQGDCDPTAIKSNTFLMEWPPRSGKQQEFPEIDRADWFSIGIARDKILKGQKGFLDQLQELLIAANTEPVPPPLSEQAAEHNREVPKSGAQAEYRQAGLFD